MRKIILDLCGGTGSWSRPYAKHPEEYDVRVITLPEYDVREYVPPESVYGILAAPPCTEFSFANCTAEKRTRDIEKGLEIVDACLNIIAKCLQSYDGLEFWALENPVGYLRNYMTGRCYQIGGYLDCTFNRHTFQPWQYGDYWTKKTDIYGDFYMPFPRYEKPEDIPEGAKLDLYTRKGRKMPSLAFQHVSAWEKIPQFSYYRPKTDAEFRAMTPPGFAEAFYYMNR